MPPSVKNPCIDCKKEVKTKSISFCICQRWVHGDCVGAETFNLVVAMNERSGFHCWSCEGCTSAYKQLSNACASNTKEINELKQTVEVLKGSCKQNQDDLKATNTEVNDIKRELKDRKNDAEAAAENTENLVLKELADRNSRKKNIVFYGIPEADPNIESYIKKKMDKTEVLEVLTEIDCSIDVDTNIKFAVRLGKKNEDSIDPRPLLIGFESEDIRNEILGKAFKLKDSELEDVSIAPDLTAKQRKEESRLKTEAKEKNEEMEDDDSKNWIWKLVGPRGEQRLIKQRRHRNPNLTTEQGKPQSQLNTKRKRKTRTENAEESEESQEESAPAAKKH
jgi:cell division protein FtsB